MVGIAVVVKGIFVVVGGVVVVLDTVVVVKTGVFEVIVIGGLVVILAEVVDEDFAGLEAAAPPDDPFFELVVEADSSWL